MKQMARAASESDCTVLHTPDISVQGAGLWSVATAPGDAPARTVTGSDPNRYRPGGLRAGAYSSAVFSLSLACGDSGSRRELTAWHAYA
eukprot:11926266-Alexandrium_andersonii.AAC.1